jgi:hypothetical protein
MLALNRSLLNREYILMTFFEVEVTLRPTVSQPVSLGVRRPSGTRDQFYYLLEIFFRQLRFCNFVAPSQELLKHNYMCCEIINK